MTTNEHALTLFEFDMKINESLPRDKILDGVASTATTGR